MSRLLKRYRRLAEDIIPAAWYSPWTPTEQELASLFEDIARAKGWRWYHTYDSRRSAPGFPDYVLVHTGQRRIVFVELKGWTGKPSDEQRAWLGDLDRAGGEAYLVTTSGDYARDAGSIAELLTARPRRTA